MRKLALFRCSLLVLPALVASRRAVGASRRRSRERAAPSGPSSGSTGDEHARRVRRRVRRACSASSPSAAGRSASSRRAGAKGLLRRRAEQPAHRRSRRPSLRRRSAAKRIPMGTFPHHMTASPDGDLVYVGRVRDAHDRRRRHVARPADRRRVLRPAANPLAKTHAVWITNDGKELYATNEGCDEASFGTLSKLERIEPASDSGRYPVGARPSEVLVTNDGKTAYVTHPQREQVRVLDVSGERPADRRGRDRHACPTRCGSRPTGRRSSSGSGARRSWR